MGVNDALTGLGDSSRTLLVVHMLSGTFSTVNSLVNSL